MQQALDIQIRRQVARRVASTVVLALIMASVASAQAWVGRGRLSGKVTGPDGGPLSGVKVTLSKKGVAGEGPEAFFSDKKGRWSYLGLGGGEWTVVLELAGMNPSEGQVRVSEFGAGQKLQIQMNEVAEAAPDESANNTQELINQGNAYLAEGQYVEARAAYEEVIAALDEEQHPALLRGVARTYYEEENVDQAIATLDKALVLVPDDAGTLKLAINLLVASGREEDAQTYMARLPEGSGVDANTVLNMGIQRYNEDDYTGSLEFFDRAAGENPNMPDVFYFRGLAYLGLGNNTSALADFKRVMEIDSAYKADEVGPFVEYLESQSGGDEAGGDGESQE